MNPSRSLPTIAPGQLPPPVANDDNSEGFVVPTQSQFDPPVTLNQPVKRPLSFYGLEEVSCCLYIAFQSK